LCFVVKTERRERFWPCTVNGAHYCSVLCTYNLYIYIYNMNHIIYKLTYNMWMCVWIERASIHIHIQIYRRTMKTLEIERDGFLFLYNHYCYYYYCIYIFFSGRPNRRDSFDIIHRRNPRGDVCVYLYVIFLYLPIYLCRMRIMDT